MRPPWSITPAASSLLDNSFIGKLFSGILPSMCVYDFGFVVFKCSCWMVLMSLQQTVKDQRRTGREPCCRLWSTMLPRRAVSVCYVLMLVLYLSAAEDFDWTKNHHDSFYYGTFPTGTQNLCRILFILILGLNRHITKADPADWFLRIFMGCRKFGLSNRRSLGQRWERTEHLGCVQSQDGQNPTKWYWGFLLWWILQIQGGMFVKYAEVMNGVLGRHHCIWMYFCTGWYISDEGAEA